MQSQDIFFLGQTEQTVTAPREPKGQERTGRELKRRTGGLRERFRRRHTRARDRTSPLDANAHAHAT
jgi:hypothetical protein